MPLLVCRLSAEGSPIAQPWPAQGSAGTVAETKESVMARGPTGLTTVFTGAMAIKAGAILSPCIHEAHLVRNCMLIALPLIFVTV